MMMLCLRCTIGGAEKRYARVFEMLVTRQPRVEHRLVINRSMLDLLNSAGILIDANTHSIVLDPPFHRYADTHPGVRFLRPLFVLLDVLWYIWRCSQIIRRHRSKVVHPLLTGVYFSLIPLLRYQRTPCVISAYTSSFEHFKHKKILGLSIAAIGNRIAMRRCQVIDALSQSIRDELVTEEIEQQKIAVAPCSFTDVSQCQPHPHKAPWVVFLARFVHNKNPELLVRAIPRVIARAPSTHFYFLGRGPLQPRIEALVEELEIAPHVTIRFAPHPTRILNRSSIFVALNRIENYPSQSLLEAMACGNAIVATDVRETWRLVDETNGVRIPPTPERVAEAILNLLNDPALGDKGAASRQRVCSDYTPERFFRYITQVYHQASKG
jgi:glycosyltransferase involved in cell wall biosynthesis